MTPEQIEKMMTDMKLAWHKVIPKMWAILDKECKLPQIVISIEKSRKSAAGLLKFLVFICDVPADSGTDFYKEFMRLNFKVEHGTFAMESHTEMSFMDTLELERLDANEFIRTLQAMREAPQYFQSKYDIETFTLGSPQF